MILSKKSPLMPIGRPIELTPEMTAQVYGLAREMVYLDAIAPLMGVSRTTLYNWIRRGAREQRRRDRGEMPKAEEQLFLDFVCAVKRGQAEAERSDLAVIEAAAKGSWQAAAWRLERSHPERWSLERNELRKLKKQVKHLLERQHIDPDTGEKKESNGDQAT